MVMTAYFDESGTHGAESPVVTVAGFIARADQWKRSPKMTEITANEIKGERPFPTPEAAERKSARAGECGGG
jgi:hypothetical protein